MSLYPIILCGGPGSRLWPASTARQPKPFLDLLGGLSLFQRTVIRMAALSDSQPPVIVTGIDHLDEVGRQMDAIGRHGVILAEPAGRDSAPALIAAATWIARLDPSGLAVAVASDHHIPDTTAFSAAVDAAIPAAMAGKIVTFGVRPTYPATAYGYIRTGARIDPSSPILQVAEFVEKPRGARAAVLVSQGCLWNSGNFMFRADVLLDEARRHAPLVVEEVTRAVACGRPGGLGLTLGASFIAAPRVSIDVAVMEKTERAAVLPIDYDWSDVGGWDAVWSALDRDVDGVAASGAAAGFDSRNCLLRAGPGARILAVGVSNLAIVAQDGDVLVLAMERAADLKSALLTLEREATPLAAAGRAESASLSEIGARLKSWLWEEALPLWWCFGADHRRGGFHERLGPDLVASGARRARVQARQVYVYATAGAMGWPGPWEAAVAHGLDYLARCYRRPDGLFRGLVDEDGAPLQEEACLYDQAFVLLAFAAAAVALPARRAEFEAEAERLAVAVRRGFDASGYGFHAEEFSSSRLADPVMHLFEAVLAWVEAGGAPSWRAWAEEIVGLSLERLIDPGVGRVFEIYDEAWRPQCTADQRFLEPGHHYEWAWLLERWSRLDTRQRGRPEAECLFAAGERGVDPATGLVWDELNDDFSVRSPTSRLWPQTERLKALLAIAASSLSPSEFERAALDAARAIERYLDTRVAGLWRDTAVPDDRIGGDVAPASSFYHIIGAIAAFEATGR